MIIGKNNTFRVFECVVLVLRSLWLCCWRFCRVDESVVFKSGAFFIEPTEDFSYSQLSFSFKDSLLKTGIGMFDHPLSRPSKYKTPFFPNVFYDCCLTPQKAHKIFKFFFNFTQYNFSLKKILYVTIFILFLLPQQPKKKNSSYTYWFLW